MQDPTPGGRLRARSLVFVVAVSAALLFILFILTFVRSRRGKRSCTARIGKFRFAPNQISRVVDKYPVRIE